MKLTDKERSALIIDCRASVFLVALFREFEAIREYVGMEPLSASDWLDRLKQCGDDRDRDVIERYMGKLEEER